MISKMYSLSTLVFLAVLVPLLIGTQGAAKSVIVDNADTRIVYSTNGWATDITCPSCFPQLDKTKVHGGTWSFSNNTANSGFTFSFTGISVELRYIASDTVQLLAERVSYAIDGAQFGIAAQAQPLSPISFAYDQSLFKVTGLPNTAHTLQVNIVQASSVMLDYLIYEDADPIVTSANIVPIPSTNPGPTTNINTNANSNPTTNANTVPAQTPNTSVNSVQTTNANAKTNPTSAGANSSPTTPNKGTNSTPTTNNGVNSSPTNTSKYSSQPSDTPLTFPDISTDSTRTSKTNVGAIIGGVTGGLALLILAVFLLYLRKRRRIMWQSETAAPYSVESPSVTIPTLRDFKNYRSLNAVMNQMPEPEPDQPVEAGLMSRSRYTSFPSDTSRRTPAST